jgi:sulfite reductase (ferredoxin)
MTTTRPARTRSEGQWALGEREPLNGLYAPKRGSRPRSGVGV